MSSRIWLLRRRMKLRRRVCHPGMHTSHRAWRATVESIMKADEAKRRHPRYVMRGVRVWLAS